MKLRLQKRSFINKGGENAFAPVRDANFCVLHDAGIVLVGAVVEIVGGEPGVFLFKQFEYGCFT